MTSLYLFVDEGNFEEPKSPSAEPTDAEDTKMLSGWPIDWGDSVQNIQKQNRTAAIEFTNILHRLKKEPVHRRPLPDEIKVKEVDLLITPLGQGAWRNMATSTQVQIVAWILERHLHWFDKSTKLDINN